VGILSSLSSAMLTAKRNRFLMLGSMHFRQEYDSSAGHLDSSSSLSAASEVRRPPSWVAT
jgi:hypothetical protein